MKSLIVIFTLVTLNTAFAAATKNEDGSFKISDKAKMTMGIRFQKLDNRNQWLLPKSSLVKIKFTEGVYRKIQDDITYVIVNVIKSNENHVFIESEDLESGDEVAIEGVQFLRLTESDLNSDTVDSCAH
ncbi:MAG TPA: hypothetical protein VKZ84_02075 [Bacteriovoracaceae bacterium]|nr:hypothetical protein [Bacteriovoracaceae bacterium]